MNYESFSQSDLPQEKQEQAEELKTGEMVFNFLDKTGFLDIRKSDEKFKEWVQKISYKDYSEYLTRLNGILREIPIKQRSVDGNFVELGFGVAGDEISYLPPATEEKDTLMRETFDVLQHISDSEDRALLAYYSIQAIHPYNDGNGRTGRLIHELFSEKGKKLNKESLSDLLDHKKIILETEKKEVCLRKMF